MATVPEGAITWIDKPVDIEFCDGFIVAHIHSGGETREYRSTPALLVATMANMARCYSGILAEQGTKVIPFRRRRRGH
jgi:hypothetical protein